MQVVAYSNVVSLACAIAGAYASASLTNERHSDTHKRGLDSVPYAEQTSLYKSALNAEILTGATYECSTRSTFNYLSEFCMLNLH